MFAPMTSHTASLNLGDWKIPDLSTSDLAEIDSILPAGFAHGDRYGDHQMAFVERYC